MKWQHEVWAEALWVVQNRRGDGPRFVADQIARLMLAGDDAGVARWRRIGEACEALRAGRLQ